MCRLGNHNIIILALIIFVVRFVRVSSLSYVVSFCFIVTSKVPFLLTISKQTEIHHLSIFLWNFESNQNAKSGHFRRMLLDISTKQKYPFLNMQIDTFVKKRSRCSRVNPCRHFLLLNRYPLPVISSGFSKNSKESTRSTTHCAIYVHTDNV